MNIARLIFTEKPKRMTDFWELNRQSFKSIKLTSKANQTLTTQSTKRIQNTNRQIYKNCQFCAKFSCFS